MVKPFTLTRDSESPLHVWQWWRHSAYRVLDRTHLVPAEGATLAAYDPFRPEPKDEAKHKRLNWEAPYVDFLDVDFRDHSAAVKWAEGHGLLGILPQRTVDCRLWPEWEKVPEDLRPYSLSDFRIRQSQYRTNIGVVEASQDHLPGNRAGDCPRQLTDLELEALSGTEEKMREGVRKPGVLVQDPWDGELHEKDLAEGLLAFFPKIEGISALTARWARRRCDSFPLPLPPLSETEEEVRRRLDRRASPLPFSTEFLHTYGEPLYLLEEYQRCLWEIESGLKEMTGEGQGQVRSGFPLMQIALGGIQSVPIPDPPTQEGSHGWSQGWQFRSLFAAMVQMMVRDRLFRNLHLCRCDWCGRLLSAKHPNRKYCDKTHRKNRQMKVRREREQVLKERVRFDD